MHSNPSAKTCMLPSGAYRHCPCSNCEASAARISSVLLHCPLWHEEMGHFEDATSPWENANVLAQAIVVTGCLLRLLTYWT